MDDIISDGNKYEAENNENGMDQITERPADEIFEVKHNEIHGFFLEVMIETRNKKQDDPNTIKAVI